MKREQLEHLLRAAGAVAEVDDIIVVGSQAILAQFPNAPQAALVSNEADVYPTHHPERADLIDGSLGEGSPFHETFGYYAQGVGPETAKLPAGWEQRLVPLRSDRTRGVTGRCLEVHDLVVSKLVAGRPKDLAFARTLADEGLVDQHTLEERAGTLEVEVVLREAVIARVRALFA